MVFFPVSRVVEDAAAATGRRILPIGDDECALEPESFGGDSDRRCGAACTRRVRLFDLLAERPATPLDDGRRWPWLPEFLLSARAFEPVILRFGRSASSADLRC